MLLNLNKSDTPMKFVYLLSEELKENPGQIVLAQALTLDKSKPYMGLKGAYGLFGSQEWWNSIEEGKMPLLFLSGVIQRTYIAGQDSSSEENSFSLLLGDGSIREESIYSHTRKEDRRLFVVGSRVEIVYALDELKPGAVDGEETHLDIVLEMAVSLQSVE
ncbi:hypothetical protein NUH87_30165 [Pseudomonas batumici]|uniref:hypothetical protein n=1 Tax=Pseudomonas batumici TaxID=226910 RepID=UPI0030CEAC70